ncbi:hypothetical protein L218DRAFT_856488, partial [Marasmius fiardii PR-910]
SRTMSTPNRSQASFASLWNLHDAPQISRPAPSDEYQHLGSRHLQRAQFLFTALSKDCSKEVPLPVGTLGQDVLEDIPLETIQPYM